MIVFLGVHVCYLKMVTTLAGAVILNIMYIVYILYNVLMYILSIL